MERYDAVGTVHLACRLLVDSLSTLVAANEIIESVAMRESYEHDGRSSK